MSSAPGSPFADLRALFINCTLKRSPQPDAGERFDFAPARPSSGG